MIDIENKIQELRDIAAEMGICCANCAKGFIGSHTSVSICTINFPHREVEHDHFCSYFEPKEQPEDDQ